MAPQKSRTELILGKIKNNKIFAVIIASGIISAIATFSESILKLVDLIGTQIEPKQYISQFEPSTKYQPSIYETYFNSDFEIANWENKNIQASKSELIVYLSVNNNKESFSYKIKKEDEIIKISPKNDYLSLLQKGGPIHPLGYLHSPFDFEFPNIDITILNNNSKSTVLFTQAIFKIKESRTDQFPILLIKGTGYNMRLPLINVGWGNVYDCKIKFNIVPSNKNFFDKDTYTHEIFVGEFKHSSEKTDLTPIFRELGVDVRTLRQGFSSQSGADGRTYTILKDGERVTISEAQYGERIQKARGIFKDGMSKVYGEIIYSGFNCGGFKSMQRLRFKANVSLGRPPMGLPLPPSYQYDVRFETDKRNYEKVVEISHEIESGKSDRFNIKISAPKSSRHIFDLILLYNKNETIIFPNIALNYFMSTADAKSVAHDPETRG